jgi:acyl-CoA synthetase (AMP-forming)/AMP-acid ligase II
MVLARWDQDKQDFLRDKRGFVIKAKRGESGILLGRERPTLAFEGYHDEKASAGKLLRNVFKEGDCYFNSGDLLRMDHRFHLYFVDRLGDTFRWKGENVATFEVQEQISKWGPVAEVNVYGVQVPDAEGRAGMAALVLADGQAFDPEAFAAHLEQALPAYARPLFVRLQRRIETTGTFKMKKAALQEEGFDPTTCSDPLFFRDPERNTYVPLDPSVYADIVGGRFRL